MKRRPARRIPAAVALLAALLPLAAAAQTFTGLERVLLSEGVLRGSPRVMGVSGAFVGVAEEAEGITRNPAAAAARNPRALADLNWDLGAALHFLPPWAVTAQDWDNDGRPDQVDPLGGAFEFFGTQVIYLATTVQYKNFGVGIGADLQNFVAAAPNGTLNLGLLHVFGSVAMALWDNQVLVGLGVESTQALVNYFQGRLPFDSVSYFGWGVQVGGLWRPTGKEYRIGFSFRPQAVGASNQPGKTDIGGTGIKPFSAIAAPARISVGASWAIGEGGRPYNATRPEDWGVVGTALDGTAIRSPAMTKWLVTTQLDVFWSVRNATYVAAFLEQNAGLPAYPAGDRISFEPRLGVEKELVRDWFRVRGGTYLEPPMVPTGYARPHITLGGEVRLFNLGEQWISFGLSFDFARRYQNLSVALLVWK